MNRPLIAISTCWDFEKNGKNDACRKTWIPAAVDFDVRFFVGKGQGAESAELPGDTILLDVDDDYKTLSYKTRAYLRWAHEREYPFCFGCFPDTYIVPSRLLECGFAAHDYFGDFHDAPVRGNYAVGGPGKFLSRKAFSLLIDAPILGSWKNENGVFRDDVTVWAEDLWVGQILKNYPELIYHDDWARFVNHGSAHFPTRGNGVITSHLSCPTPYTSTDRMWAAHNSYLHG